MSDDIQQHRRLPVWRTVKASYLVFWNNLWLATKLGALPVLIGFSYALALSHIIDSEWENLPIRLEILTALGDLPFWLASIPAITAWHRLVLLGYSHPESRLNFTIRWSEWLYLYRLFQGAVPDNYLR